MMNILFVLFTMTETPHTLPIEPLTRPVSFSDVKARLALVNHTRLAATWGVDRSSITNCINGRRPWSPLVPRLARYIKVPTDLLRSYFIELGAQTAEHRAAQHAE